MYTVHINILLLESWQYKRKIDGILVRGNGLESARVCSLLSRVLLVVYLWKHARALDAILYYYIFFLFYMQISILSVVVCAARTEPSVCEIL